MRRHLGEAAKGKPRRRKVGIVEVGCLDICPKGGVVVIRAAAPGRWLVVPRDMPMADAVERLGLDLD